MSMSMIETSRRPAAREDSWFEAVRRRDRAFDGKVFFAVRTTGVYCRPSCASRPAKRENVSFYESADAAERAGYRACKRCRPDRLGAADPAGRGGAPRLRADRLGRGGAVAQELAAGAGLSPFHFHRVFKKIDRRHAEGLRR